MELMDKIKILIGAEDSKAPIIQLLVEEAKSDAVNYCNLDSYDEKLDYVVIKMVRFKYSRLGTEGLAAQSYSGVSESFQEDYPADIYKDLRHFRRLPR